MPGEGIDLTELELARAKMTAAEDRLENVQTRARTASNPIGRILARRQVRIAGREVHDSGENLGMLEELRYRLEHPEDTGGF